MASLFRCIVCGSSTGSPVLSGCVDYYLQKPYRATYARCESCGLIQQAPVPSDVTSFYQDYPIHQRKSSLHRLMREWVMSACYFRAEEFLCSRNGPVVILDFGCGDGWFLDKSSRDPRLKLIGFEPNSKHATYLADTLKRPVYDNERSLLRDYEGKVDVVAMHFVLEHLTDVNAAFETVHRLLKMDGIFYFVVPNISSWEARLFGKKWHGLDAPRHISFPTAKSIGRLCERWGFEVTKQGDVPFPNGFAGSVPVVLTGRFRFSIFLFFLPFGIILSRLFPSGAAAYWLSKSAN